MPQPSRMPPTGNESACVFDTNVNKLLLFSGHQGSGGPLLLCVTCLAAFAIPITLFMDTDTYIERAKDIVVAECISIFARGGENGLRVAEVNILKVLKGGRKPGRFRIATAYPMQPHTTYMLCSLGGDVAGTNFLALPELSVVPLPSTFRIDELRDRDLKEQVQCIFSRRLFELERQLAPLLEEKELLERAVSDRRYEWYESDGPIEIEEVFQVTTETEGGGPLSLDLQGRKLAWSHSSPGRNGFFYFQKIRDRTPLWEFSPCEAAKIEDLSGKPLKAKFYGKYTPGRGDTVLGATAYNAILVAVGQVLFARTVDDPRTIFIIQIEAQKQDQERMSARYTVVHH